MFRIFRSMYEARCKNPTPGAKNTYSTISTIIPHEPLDADKSDYKHTLYELAIDDSCDSLDILIEKIQAKKTDIVDSIKSVLLKEEAELTINLLVAAIKRLNSKDDEILKKDLYKWKYNLAENKERQNKKKLEKYSDCHRCSKTDFKLRLAWGWATAAFLLAFNPVNFKQLSITNRVTIWILNVALQQQVYSLLNSNNYFNYIREIFPYVG